MPALRVAIDLTALECDANRPIDGFRQVRFARGLIHHARAVEFVVLTRRGADSQLRQLEAPNARQLTIAEPSRSRALFARFERRVRRRLARTRLGERVGSLSRFRPILARWQGPGVLRKLGVDVAFRPFVYSGLSDPSVPLVVAIDDLQHVSHPHLLTSNERGARAHAFDTAARRAARIVCSSRSLRDTAIQCDGVPVDRVLTALPGPLLEQPATTEPAIRATLARHGLEANTFFLFVADLEPRHNHRVVLTALALFRAKHPASEIKLVCLGGPDNSAAAFTKIAERMGLGGSVSLPGALARGEISALIQSCRAVIVASLYENLGETVLEAMRRGRPVLCSQIPSLAELVGSAALTFDPHRPAELAAALERTEREPALLDRLAQLGRERLTTLDDAQSVAQAYLGVFREARTACLPSQ